jgi:hypothetical protein
VENIRERDTPFDTVRAHLGYWKRPAFGERLYAAIVEADAAGAVRARDARLPALFRPDPIA